MRLVLMQASELYRTQLRHFEESQLDFIRRVLAVAANPGGASRLATHFTRDSFTEFIYPILEDFNQRELADRVISIYDQNDAAAAQEDPDLGDTDAEGEDDLEEEELTVPPPSRRTKSKTDKA
jgi:hypothetical protein